MSDQDFFFDEEEKPAQKQTPASSKSGSKQTSAGSKPDNKQPAKVTPKSAPAPQQSGGIELTWTVVALIGIVALLVGVIVGYAIPKGSTADSTGLPTQAAPQLSPDQLESGQLPPGHPNIGGGSSAATGSATTTGN